MVLVDEIGDLCDLPFAWILEVGHLPGKSTVERLLQLVNPARWTVGVALLACELVIGAEIQLLIRRIRQRLVLRHDARWLALDDLDVGLGFQVLAQVQEGFFGSLLLNYILT